MPCAPPRGLDFTFRELSRISYSGRRTPPSLSEPGGEGIREGGVSDVDWGGSNELLGGVPFHRAALKYLST